MSSIWERNAAAFKKRYGFDLPEAPGAETRYRTGEAINGMPILYCVDEETGEEKRLNSLYDPAYEAERWAQKIDPDNVRALLALQGFLNGYFARAALQVLNRRDSYVVAYESDIALFSFVCHHFDITDLLLDERFDIYLPKHHADTFYKTMADKISDINRAKLYMQVTPGYQIDRDFYEECSSLNSYLTADANTREKLGRADSLNFLRTIKGLSTNSCLLRLKELLQDVDIPAVIVAAGPSLRKNVALLKEITDKALIVAVDRAVPVLSEFGIRPHMTATVDAVKNPVFLESNLVKDLPVLFYSMGNRVTQDAHEGHLIYFGVGGAFFGVDDIDELLMPYGNVGGSVATAIFTCLYQIGFKDIILIGQDLAYDKDLHTHADGSMRNPETHNMEEVPGVDGTPVYTRFDWQGFITFYEQEIILHPELNVIDATEGGALIRGTKLMTFREAIDEFCTKQADVEQMLSTLPKAVDEAWEKRLTEHILRFIPQLHAIKRYASEGISFSDQVRKAAQYGKDVFEEYYVNKMKEAEVRRSMIRIQQAYMLLENYAVPSKDDLPGDELFVRTQEEALELYTLLSRYFTLMRDKAEELAEEIRRVFSAEENEVFS